MLGVQLNFLPQLTDMHHHSFRIDCFLIPDGLIYLLCLKNTPRMLHQQLQYHKLLRPQLDDLIIHTHFLCRAV